MQAPNLDACPYAFYYRVLFFSPPLFIAVPIMCNPGMRKRQSTLEMYTRRRVASTLSKLIPLVTCQAPPFFIFAYFYLWPSLFGFTLENAKTKNAERLKNKERDEKCLRKLKLGNKLQEIEKIPCNLSLIHI